MKKITKILLGSLGCIGASCFAPFVSSCEAPTFSFQVLTGIPVPQKFGNNNFGDTLKDLVDKQPEQYPVLTDFIKDCFFQVAQTVTETDSVSFNVSLGHNLYTAFLFGYCPESSQVNPSNVNVTWLHGANEGEDGVYVAKQSQSINYEWIELPRSLNPTEGDPEKIPFLFVKIDTQSPSNENVLDFSLKYGDSGTVLQKLIIS